MYSFKIKADVSDVTVPPLRSITGVALIVVLFYKNDLNSTSIIIHAAMLIAILLFIENLLVKLKVNSILLTSIVALIVFFSTHNVIFPTFLLLLSVGIKYSYTQPTISVAESGIIVKKTFKKNNYNWQNLNNIVLKDNLLTLDFKNNKVLQLEIEDNNNTDEPSFNKYCAQQLTTD